MSTQNKKQRIFVYGTLKSTGSNSHITAREGEYIETVQLKFNGCAMYEVVKGGNYPFPAILENGETHPVIGEIWEVDNLKRFDRIEGYPKLYQRDKFELDGHDVWVYFLPPHYAGLCDLSHPIKVW